MYLLNIYGSGGGVNRRCSGYDFFHFKSVLLSLIIGIWYALALRARNKANPTVHSFIALVFNIQALLYDLRLGGHRPMVPSA